MWFLFSELTRIFSSAENRDERSHRIFYGAFEIFNFFLEEITGGGFRNIFRDADCGGMGPVGGTERVIDVHIGEGCQGLGESVVILLFFRMETEIFQEHDVAGLHLGDETFDCRPDAIRGKNQNFAEQPLETFCDGGQTQLRIESALWPAEVGAEDDLCSLINGTIDGGKRGSNSGVVGDLQ